MTRQPKIPRQCHTCQHHWTGGKAGTVYVNWCCKFSGCAADKIKHCNLHGGYTARVTIIKK